MGFNTPLQVAEAVSNAGKTKSCLPFVQMIILGIFAGAYIAFGAELATMVMTGTADKLGLGMTKFLGGAVFSTGLMLVVIGGAELFTGNNLMTIGLSRNSSDSPDSSTTGYSSTSQTSSDHCCLCTSCTNQISGIRAVTQWVLLHWVLLQAR
jgi:hypothetical protein